MSKQSGEVVSRERRRRLPPRPQGDRVGDWPHGTGEIAMSVGKPADDVSIESFPEVEAMHNEDPARFLDVDDVLDDHSKRRLTLARIDGIDEIALLNAWEAVERRLTGGRSWVLDAIDARRDDLAQLGDRDERDLEPIDRDVTAKVVEFVDEDGEPRKRRASLSGSLLDRLDAESGGEVA